jgi:sucrose-6-phosphate hydrolase SacC (GH32 family)
LVFYQGEYHLFFQRTPDSLEGGLKSWGHAVSTDLLHWKQLGDAIEPDKLGDIWSGSAAVDWNNTGGFQTGDEKTIVAMYTAAGNTFGQCLAYSNDRGRTWTKYAGNPVLPRVHAQNRDPKLVWFAPTRKWVVAIYLDQGSDYALFTSPDLKHWTQIQKVPVPHAAECPDFFPINLDDDPRKPTWVFTGANGRYLVGTFDGQTFTYAGTSHVVEYDDNCYAVQTFSDMPDGRRIQIGWMRDGKYPEMPFNQQMSFPCRLTLHTTPAGPRLFKYPIEEIESLHGRQHEWKDAQLSPGADLLNGLSGDLFDINLELEPETTTIVTVNIRGTAVQYDAAKERLLNGNHAPLKPETGRIKLRILVDRTSIEVFGNDGQVAISRCFLPKLQDRAVTLQCEGGKVGVPLVRVYEMRTVW